MKDLILFRNLSNSDIMRGMVSLAGNNEESSGETAAYVTSELIRLAEEFSFEGNLWQCYLTYALIKNENPFSLASEMKGKAGESLEKAALRDIKILRDCYRIDLRDIGKNWGRYIPDILSDYKRDDTRNSREAFYEGMRDRILLLSRRLSEAGSDEGFLDLLKEFYGVSGAGEFALHRAFRIAGGGERELKVEPISFLRKVSLDDIVGMEAQKKKLTDNTEAFLDGRKANNVLLFGDAGTGKSTCIKGLLNRYSDRGLRIIEIYKHQYRELNALINILKNRNYRFVIYMDDLSFEDSETEYKNLKAVMEGGLEKRPENILLYATSNRRHLIHEGFSDRLDRTDTDDIHESDTVQEKLSLSARFGERIYFGRPSKKEYDNIVLTLAERRGIKTDKELLLKEANKWELYHGGMTGRTAEQFIDYMEGVST